MQYNVLNYPENTAIRHCEKVAVINESHSIHRGEFLHACKQTGTGLAKRQAFGASVAVYMEKSIDALISFFGAVYAGASYSFPNPELPDACLQSIQRVLAANLAEFKAFSEQQQSINNDSL